MNTPETLVGQVVRSTNLLCDLIPDPIGELLGTGYMRFSTRLGIRGLCKVAGQRIDVLAVLADKPGRGAFRRFISQAKREFQTVAIW